MGGAGQEGHVISLSSPKSKCQIQLSKAEYQLTFVEQAPGSGEGAAHTMDWETSKAESGSPELSDCWRPAPYDSENPVTIWLLHRPGNWEGHRGCLGLWGITWSDSRNSEFPEWGEAPHGVLGIHTTEYIDPFLGLCAWVGGVSRNDELTLGSWFTLVQRKTEVVNTPASMTLPFYWW